MGIVRVIGGLVAVAVVCGGAFALVGSFFQQEESVSFVAAESVTRLVANDDVGDVTVRAGAPGEPLRVVRVLHWAGDRPQSQVSVTSGVAQVSGRCPNGLRLNAFCSVDLQITLPPAATLDITSATGDVSVDGVTGSVRVIGSTGDLRLTNLRATDVELQASTGDVSASFAQPPTTVRARTSTGDLTVALPAGQAYRVNAQTSLGDRTVDVAQDASSTHTVDASTSVGDVQVTRLP